MKPRMFAVATAFLIVLSGVAAGYTLGFGPVPPQEPAGTATIDDMLAFTEQLTALAKDETLTENERALRVTELATRQQVVQLGLEWVDDVHVPDHALPGDAIRALSEHLGGVIGPEQEAALDGMDALPAPVRDALAKTVNAFHALDLATKNVYTEADLEHLEALAKQHGDELSEEVWLEQVGERIAGIFSARLALVEAAFELKEALEEEGEGLEVPSLMVPMGHDSDLLEVHEEIGEDLPAVGSVIICINSHNETNVYNEDCNLLIDTSLDAGKKYYNNAGGQNGLGASALIDFGGDNQYGDPENPRGEGANGGAYSSNLGATGFGVLMSLGTGNSTFTAGDEGVNGGAKSDPVSHAPMTVGFLLSGGGNNVFDAGDEGVNGGAYVAEGSGLTPVSVGLLIDVFGNDQYFATGDRGVNGGANADGGDSSIVGALLLDLAGTDYYQDGSIPAPGEDAYFCMTDPFGDGDCGFEGDDEDWNSCWNCSVIPKGENGAQIDVGVPEEIDPVGLVENAIDDIHGVIEENTPDIEDVLEEITPGSLDEGCVSSPCLKFWFRGENVTDGVGMPNVGEDGVLSMEPPYGVVPVVHSGSQDVDGARAVVLVSEPFEEDVLLDEDREVLGELHVRAWTSVFQNAATTYELVAEPSDGEGDVITIFQKIVPGSLQVLEDLVQLEEVPDGLTIPAGHRLVFTFVSGGSTTDGSAFSLLYDSTEFPSHIELPLAPEFEPIGIEIEWDEEMDEEAGFVVLTAGEPVVLRAVGTNVTGDSETVSVNWTNEPEDRGSFSEGEDGMVFTPMKAGDGNIMAKWENSTATVTDTVDIRVVPGDVSQLKIRTAAGGGDEPEEPLAFTGGESVTLYAAGYDGGENFIEDVSVPVAAWSVVPDDAEMDPDDFGTFSVGASGGVEFMPGREGEGTILVDHDDMQASVEVEISPGDLASLEIEVEVDDERVVVTDHLEGIEAGNKTVLFAVGYDAGGNLLGDFDVVWTLNPQGLGVLDPGDANVTFIPQKTGSGTIIASYPSAGNPDVVSGPVQVAVVPGPPVQVGFEESVPQVEVDTEHALPVRVEDAFGNAVTNGGLLVEFEGADVTLTLESGSGGLVAQGAEIDGNGEALVEGFVYCCAAGTIEIRVNATDGDGNDVLNGTVTSVTVDPGPLNHVFVQEHPGVQRNHQGSFGVVVERSLTLHAVGYDGFNNRRAVEPVGWTLVWDGEGQPDWSDPDPEAGSITFESTRTGTATVTATHADSAVDGTTFEITVLPDDLHRIEIRTQGGNSGEPVDDAYLMGLHGGERKELFAAGYDELDNYIADVPVQWEIDPPEERGFFNEFGQSPSVRFTAGKIGTGYVNVTGPVMIDNGVIKVSVTHPGPPGELVFDTPGGDFIAGETWPDIELRVEDGFGNHVDDDETQVSLRVGKGYKEPLKGDALTQQAQEGFVTFQGVSYRVADSIWIVAHADGIPPKPNGPYNVTPTELDSIRIQKDTKNGREDVTALDDLTAGNQVRLFAAGYDEFNNYVGDVTAEWEWGFDDSLEDPTQGSSFTFKPETVGQGIIHAKKEGMQDFVSFTVHPGPLDHFKIRDAPDGNGEHMESLRLPTGNTTRLYAAGYDAFGNYLTDVQVDWRLDPPRLGTLEPTAQTKNATFTAKQGGTGRIVADHTDLPGDVTVNLQVDADIMPPQAIIAASCTELTCTLDASGSKPGTAAIASYTWDLGDGNTQQGENLEHTYAEPGEYTLTLNVSDGNGLSHETQHTVTVTLPPEPMITLEVTTRPQDPAPGEAVTATATIENVGSVALLQFSVAFTLDEEPLREQSYPRLEAGENMTIRATWNAHEGNQTLIVEIPGHATQSQQIQVATTDTLPDGAPPGITAQEAPAAPLIIVLLVVFAVPWILKRRQPTRETASVSSQDPTQSMARNRGHGRSPARKPITVLCIALLASLALAGCVDGLDLEPGAPEEPRFTLSLEAQPTQGGVQVRWDATPLEGSSLARVEIQAVKPPAPGDDSEPIRHGWNQTNPPAAGSHVIALPPGQWHLAARAEDDTGREAWSQDRIVTLSQPRFSEQSAQSAGQAEPLRINAGQDKVIHDAQGKGEASFTLNGETRPGPGQRVLGHEWRYDDGAGVRQAVLATFTRPIGEHVFTFHVEYEDAQGIKGVAEDTVRVQVLPNRAPVADAGPSREARDAGGSGGVEVVLDGSRSFDPDGRIVSYSWESDGSVVLSQREGVVRFPVGTHSVTLTVRDNAGATGQDTTRVIVHPGHHPVARGVASDGIDLDGDGTGAVELDGSSSFHPDGTITRYVWNDAGGNAVGAQAIVTLTVDMGTHEFTLVVEDEAGRTGTDNVMVTVLPQPDPPQAHFQANCSGLTCTFDASGSTGYGLAYDWDFGDGSTGFGQSVTHDYAEVATYPVTLVVRDASGRTATLQENVNLRPDHSLDIFSPSFGPGDEIPGQYGCQLAVNGYPSFLLGVHPLSVELGNSPPLVLVAPQNAQTLAFTILDMTEGVNGQPMRNVHWLSYDIEVPPEGIVEISQGTPGSGTQGMNHKGMSGFTEFCSLLLPALTDSSNTYEFRVYALDGALGLEEGADLEEFEQAIDGHVLATDSFDAFYSDKVCLELVTVEGVSPDDCVMF